MSSLPATVADFYRYVVGVDTHAATHSYAIVARTGALIDDASFPTNLAGLRRARDWIGCRTGGDLDGVLVATEGTGSYGALLGDVLEEAGYRVVEAPTPRRERGRGKTDALDAVLAARAVLVEPLVMLRKPPCRRGTHGSASAHSGARQSQRRPTALHQRSDIVGPQP